MTRFCILALAVAFPAGGAAQAGGGHPYRNLSQPIHPTLVEYEVRVPMRDGIHLAANIVRPTAAGRFPVIVNYVPYGKAPDPWFAERGYVTISAEGRGTGRSEGIMADYFDAQSFRDGYDLVEWAAKQPWSTGKVGMWGISFGAINATRVAALAPPHLAAIAVNSSYANFFGDHWYPGGVRTNHPYVWHGVSNVLFTMLRGPGYDDGTGGAVLDLDTWKRHIADNGWQQFFPPQWAHSRYDDYWREKDLRSKYQSFAVPTLQTANYFDHARNLDEAFQNYLVLREHKVPQRLFVGPWTHGGFGPGQPLDFQLLRLAWFDRFLKGVATGIDEEPPVTLFVMRENRWRHEADWPIARSVLTPFYPAADRSLRRAPGAAPGGSIGFRYQPWVGSAAGPYGTWFNAEYDDYLVQPDQRVDEAESLTFTSEPLAADLEVTGMPEIVFFASSTSDDTDFSIKLSDVLPSGKSESVTRGWLNSSYRDSDVNPRRPADWRFVEPTPITPGANNRYRVTLQNVSYLFRRGHRIRLTIASSDWPSNWPNPKPADNTIHLQRGAERTALFLPLVPRPSRSLEEPRLPLLSVRDRRRDPDTRIWLEQDLTAGVTSYRSRDSSEQQIAGGTVSALTQWRIDLTKTAPYRQTIDYVTTVTVSRPGHAPTRFVYRVRTDSAGPRASVDLREGAVP